MLENVDLVMYTPIIATNLTALYRIIYNGTGRSEVNISKPKTHQKHCMYISGSTYNSVIIILYS